MFVHLLTLLRIQRTNNYLIDLSAGHKDAHSNRCGERVFKPCLEPQPLNYCGCYYLRLLLFLD